MQKIDQLIAERERLSKRIDEEVRRTRISALARIHDLMATYGLSPSDVAVAPKPRGKGTLAGRKLPIRYRHPTTGDVWTGRGLRPKWLTEELAKGAQIQEFDIRTE